MGKLKKGEICRVKYSRKRFKHEENGYLVIITDINYDPNLKLRNEDGISILRLVNGIWIKSGKMINWEPEDFFEKIKQKT